jgi:hypothetical protein
MMGPYAIDYRTCPHGRERLPEVRQECPGRHNRTQNRAISPTLSPAVICRNPPNPAVPPLRVGEGDSNPQPDIHNGLPVHDLENNQKPGGADSGAVPLAGSISDPSLAVLAKAWVMLPDDMKAGILAMVKAGLGPNAEQ